MALNFLTYPDLLALDRSARKVLLSKLLEWLFSRFKFTAPCSTGHENFFLFSLAEPFSLSYTKVDEDDRDGSDATKDEEGAIVGPFHEYFRCEALHGLPEIEGEYAGC